MVRLHLPRPDAVGLRSFDLSRRLLAQRKPSVAPVFSE